MPLFTVFVEENEVRNMILVAIPITPWYVGCRCIYSFTFAIYASTKGHNFKLCKPRACTNVKLNSFSNWVINGWNNLLANVITAHSLKCFKNLLDIHWNISALINACFVTRIHRM